MTRTHGQGDDPDLDPMLWYSSVACPAKLRLFDEFPERYVDLPCMLFAGHAPTRHHAIAGHASIHWTGGLLEEVSVEESSP